jgi:hypothetical protein
VGKFDVRCVLSPAGNAGVTTSSSPEWGVKIIATNVGGTLGIVDRGAADRTVELRRILVPSRQHATQELKGVVESMTRKGNR